jgi:hypothetical protein
VLLANCSPLGTTVPGRWNMIVPTAIKIIENTISRYGRTP